MHESWKSILKNELDSKDYKELQEYLYDRRKIVNIFPAPENVFNAFSIPFDDVKAVIIGQDPFHGAGQAHGYSFSVLDGIKPPPSLLNIFKELESDIPNWKRPTSGNLEKWARQGVLLLNTVLTVEEGRPNSHKAKGWEFLTMAAVKALSDRGKTVFLLWGRNAQALSFCIDAHTNTVLATSHPSPLSSREGFFGCRHFSKTNEALRSYGKLEIDWNL